MELPKEPTMSDCQSATSLKLSIPPMALLFRHPLSWRLKLGQLSWLIWLIFSSDLNFSLQLSKLKGLSVWNQSCCAPIFKSEGSTLRITSTSRKTCPQTCDSNSPSTSKDGRSSSTGKASLRAGIAKIKILSHNLEVIRANSRRETTSLELRKKKRKRCNRK